MSPENQNVSTPRNESNLVYQNLYIVLLYTEKKKEKSTIYTYFVSGFGKHLKAIYIENSVNQNLNK